MTLDEAIEAGKEISRSYGETCVFRTPYASESYEAIAGIPVLGGTVVAILNDGKVLRQLPAKGSAQ